MFNNFKKMMLAFVVLTVMLAGTVSAIELNPFAEKAIPDKELRSDMDAFIKDDFNEVYGSIRVSKTFMWVETERIAEYSLTDNSEKCLLNSTCHARGKAVLYQDGVLFDSFDAKDIRGNLVEIKDLKIYLYEEQSHEIQVPDAVEQVCHDAVSHANGSTSDAYCSNVVVSYRPEVINETVAVEYDNRILPAGSYTWMITGRKETRDNVDWAVGFRGISSDEVRKTWANWTTAECKGQGGYVYIDGDYCVHSFNSSGTFGIVLNITGAQVLTVAGGGSGGDNQGGGGGAGGLIFNNSVNITSNQTVTVGLGGAQTSGAGVQGNRGQNSSFGTISGIALGGGGGKDRNAGSNSNGGSGGGASFGNAVGGNGTAGQGFNGGNLTGTFGNAGGGGAGSGGVLNGTSNNGGRGGAGLNFSINGTNMFYAGGGGGGAGGGGCQGAGGSGIGGQGSTDSGDGTCGAGSATATPGRNGTGSGGGGANPGTGGAGGSGIVIVRYLAGGFQALNVQLISPVNGANTSATAMIFNATMSPQFAENMNATLFVWNGTGSLFNRTTNVVTGNVTNSTVWNITGFSEGNYEWNVFACANGTNAVILCSWGGSNRTFSIDFSPPSETFVALQNITVTNSTPVNVGFFINQTDAHPGYCWTEFGGVNTTRTCGANFNIAFPTFGNFTVRGWVNDSLGTATFIDRSVLVVFYNQSQSVSTVAEGGASTFTLVVNSTVNPTTATLRYNNTNFAPTSQIVGTNGTIFGYTLVLPIGWGNSTGRTQFWNWTFTLLGANTTTATQTQTVLSITPTDCSSGGLLVYNFTHFDEETQAPFNYSNGNNLQIDMTISSILDSSIAVHYNNTKINSPSILVCVPSGALTGNSYRVDMTGSYVGTDFVQEFYYIDNGTISASTVPQNISWYDLAVDDSTTFLFTFLDENGIEVPNIIVQTMRYYIGQAQFVEVERSKSDNNGETHIHLVEEDVIYLFNITLEGQSIFVSDQYNAKCLSTPCSITLSAQPDNEPFPTVFNNLPEGSYRVVADQSTRDVTLYFNLNETATMNFTVWTANNNVAEPVASGTLTASAGALTVNVPLQYGNATYTGVIYMDSQFVASQVVELDEDANDYFGAMGLFLASLAVLTLALIGSSQGEWVILWTALGVVVVGVMFLVDVPWYGLMTFVAGAGILLIKLVQRRRIS